MARIIKSYDVSSEGWLVPDPDAIQLGPLDGRMYVSLDVDADLSEMDGDNTLDIQDVDLSDADLLHRLRSVTQHTWQINNATKEAIREKYTAEDEIQAIRESDTDYTSFVSGIVTAAAAEKDALGLVAPST